MLERHEQRQKVILEQEIANKKDELPELVIEFNSNKARRNYEYFTTMMRAAVPDEQWKYWSYNPAYMDQGGEKEKTKDSGDGEIQESNS